MVPAGAVCSKRTGESGAASRAARPAGMNDATLIAAMTTSAAPPSANAVLPGVRVPAAGTASAYAAGGASTGARKR